MTHFQISPSTIKQIKERCSDVQVALLLCGLIVRKRNAEMNIFLRRHPTVIKEYDEKLVRRLIDKVTVHENRFEVVFRSGVAVEVEE